MRRLLLAVLFVALPLASAAPVSAQAWVLAPASDGAATISQLFWFTLILAVIVFVLVEGLLIYSSLRFRRRAPLPGAEPPQIHGNTRLEVMWAAVPALILVGLFGITVTRLGELSQLPTDPDTLHIGVTGRQYQWEFTYGNSGIKSTNELHIPTGQPLIFEVTSADVIHSFWVPDLYGKIDANPGRVNRISFKATAPGEYRGVCAELCGAGHGAMLFRVQAVAQSDFQDWLRDQAGGGGAPGGQAGGAAPAPGGAGANGPAASPVASPVGSPPPSVPAGAPSPTTGAASTAVAVSSPGAATAGSPVPSVPSPIVSPGPSPSPLASPSPGAAPAAPGNPGAAPGGGAPGGANPALVAAGQALITSKGCGACHTVPGVAGATGVIGPNLAGIATRNPIAGGAVPNTGPDDLKRWIMSPNTVKPGTAMPNLNLSDADATALVAFLETLR